MMQYFFNGCNLIYKLSHTSGSQTLRSTNMIEVKAPRLYGVASAVDLGMSPWIPANISVGLTGVLEYLTACAGF